MGKLADDIGSDTITIAGGFQYSRVSIERLLATSYTLGTLNIDITGSLGGREKDLERIMSEIVEKLQDEDTAQNILWRVVVFNNEVGVKEIHGFKLLQDIEPSKDYTGIYCDGGTPLFDAVGSSIEATLVEAEHLYDEEFAVNGILVIVTDGDDNASDLDAEDIKDNTDRAMRGEKIESFRTILVGVNPNSSDINWKNYVSKKLSEFQVKANLSEYHDIDDFTDDAIKKIILQVSSITSDTSKVLGSGGPSQLTF